MPIKTRVFVSCDRDGCPVGEIDSLVARDRLWWKVQVNHQIPSQWVPGSVSIRPTTVHDFMATNGPENPEVQILTACSQECALQIAAGFLPSTMSKDQREAQSPLEFRP